jgi:hypothetical protein
MGNIRHKHTSDQGDPRYNVTSQNDMERLRVQDGVAPCIGIWIRDHFHNLVPNNGHHPISLQGNAPISLTHTHTHTHTHAHTHTYTPTRTDKYTHTHRERERQRQRERERERERERVAHVVISTVPCPSTHVMTSTVPCP